ncbi:hypothetical protein F8S13_23010 [Chloroflexia bacterium SDU3-3]|nr:hypothetical protein F8S13_23010 [Chloroflexia bacterium SDU3-3]
MVFAGMSPMTADSWSDVGPEAQQAQPISFRTLYDDLRALYSGTQREMTVDTVLVDIQAMYPRAALPIPLETMAADLRALYGCERVSWADFSADFAALYTMRSARHR